MRIMHCTDSHESLVSIGFGLVFTCLASGRVKSCSYNHSDWCASTDSCEYRYAGKTRMGPPVKALVQRGPSNNVPSNYAGQGPESGQQR